MASFTSAKLNSLHPNIEFMLANNLTISPINVHFTVIIDSLRGRSYSDYLFSSAPNLHWSFILYTVFQ